MLKHSDAKQPCTTCVRSYAHTRKLNPLTAPEHLECTYDWIGDVPDDINAIIIRLEARNGESRETFRHEAKQN